MRVKTILRVTAQRLLPTSVIRYLGARRGFFVFHKHYGHHAEDVLAAQFFDRLGVKTGFYLDIGCFHPRWISNTHLLHERGWHGMGVDIDRLKIDLYERSRKPLATGVVAAITPYRNGNAIDFYRFRLPWSDIDTLDRQTAESYTKKYGVPFTVDTVASLHINDILKRCGQHVNFFNIDVEGLDLEIIQQIDFKTYRPDLICFEDNSAKILPSRRVQDFLSATGYTHVFSSGPSHGYARSELV